MSPTSTADMPSRVTHVAVHVSDMERSIRFYRDVLGWRQIFDVEADLKALEKTLGPNARCRSVGGRIGQLGVELVQANYGPATPPAHGLGLEILSLQVADAQKNYERLQALGVPICNPPMEVEGINGVKCRICIALDPDGQRIEFVEYDGGCPWDVEPR